MVEIGVVSKKDHTAALEFIFGSIENYRNSPQLKHVIARAEECEKLANGIETFYTNILNNVSWFRIYTKIYTIVGRRLVRTALVKQLQHLKNRYLNQRGLPTNFYIRVIDTEFDKLVALYPDLINHVRNNFYGVHGAGSSDGVSGK